MNKIRLRGQVSCGVVAGSTHEGDSTVIVLMIGENGYDGEQYQISVELTDRTQIDRFGNSILLALSSLKIN